MGRSGGKGEGENLGGVLSYPHIHPRAGLLRLSFFVLRNVRRQESDAGAHDGECCLVGGQLALVCLVMERNPNRVLPRRHPVERHEICVRAGDGVKVGAIHGDDCARRIGTAFRQWMCKNHTKGVETIVCIQMAILKLAQVEG